MADPIKRLNFFKHQFLRASDFIDEQKYHMEMRRRHNRTLHTWGIAGSGLKVTFAQGATAVSISPGMAVDNQGREIILTEDRSVELSGFPAGQALFITIAYGEKQTNPTNETGAEGNTRWTEDPQLQASAAKPGDVGANIVLARVTRNGLLVNGVDESERRAAGVEAGDLTVRVLTLSRPNVDAGAWPRLSCSAANQSALENGSLKIDANREVLFTDGGQLRSFDNSHRIVFNRPNNRLELYEFGDIAFLTGGASPAERMRVGSNGNVGIGVGGTADSQLHISGGQWDLTNNEGDLKIGNAALRLKVGVALGGGGAGDVRLRAVGGTNRMMLGSGTNDTLTIVGANVGIGTTDPKFPLNFASVLGDKISLWGSGDNHYGFGIQGALLQIHTDTAGADVAFGFGPSANFKETMRIKGNGRVGIGTSTPGAKLELNDGDFIIKAAAEDPGDIVFQNSAGVQKGRIFADPAAGPGLNFSSGDNVARIAIDGNGNVGIGHSGPTFPLDVNGRMKVRGTGGTGSAGIWYTNAAGQDRAFIGLQDDNIVGFWSNLGPGWSFTMDLNTSKIRSPMWRVIRVFEAAPGPMVKSAPFTSNGGMMMIFASGSGWLAAGGQMGMSVKVDGVQRGLARGFTNEPGSHKTFVPVLLVESVAAGSHTLTLEPIGPTLSDGNDFYNVTIVEMPI